MEIQELSKIIGDVSLTALLFFAWLGERKERIRITREYIEYMRSKKAGEETMEKTSAKIDISQGA